MLSEKVKVLNGDINYVFNELETFEVKTKNDVRRMKEFFKIWFDDVVKEFEKGRYTYASVKKPDTSFLNTNNMLVIDYTRYKNFEFDALLYLLNQPKFIGELRDTLSNFEEKNVFKSIVQDLMITSILENKKTPENLKKCFSFFADGKNELNKSIKEYLGRSITVEFNDDGLIENKIKDLFASSNKNDFPSDLTDFMSDMVDLYKQRKMPREYFYVVNDFLSELLVMFKTYNDITKKSNKATSKVLYNLLIKIKYKLDNGLIVSDKLINELKGYKDFYEYFFESPTLINEILGILKIYNDELRSIEEDSKIEEEYVDEEKELLNNEKQMIVTYVKENVFDKFSCISNIYNPSVRIDEEELIKNLPATNKKEGFDIMMKVLKSNNVNHELNDLINRLYLYERMQKKTFLKNKKSLLYCEVVR